MVPKAAITVPALSGRPSHSLSHRLWRRLQPVFTPRFLKFATVGTSGVVVNVGMLRLLSGLGVQDNIASAVGIELSIVSNFILNHRWTFGDHRDRGVPFWRQAGRFHLVSFGGAAINFTVFVLMNLFWFLYQGDPAQVDAYVHQVGSLVDLWIVRPLSNPPDVGGWKYLSQLLGIAAATFWNFLVNFHWTWRVQTDD